MFPKPSDSCLIDGQRLGDASCTMHRPGYMDVQGHHSPLAVTEPQFRQGFEASSLASSPWLLHMANLEERSTFVITAMLRCGPEVAGVRGDIP